MDLPKPDSKKYSELVDDVRTGIIRIPKFQREFVWGMEKTAQLLDSILKGYPIGTFILWETTERLNDISKDFNKICNVNLHDVPEGNKIQYVLDGQQRIISLFVAYLGTQITREGKKKPHDYKNIVVNLDEDIGGEDGQIVTCKPTGDNHIPLYDITREGYKHAEIIKQYKKEEHVEKIHDYQRIIDSYAFSVVILKKDDIDSAIEVFTRINTSGQALTLFEIMSAKTYDEERQFDMQEKKEEDLDKELEGIGYGEISGIVILHTLSMVLSNPRECKRSVILNLDKQKIIDKWDDVVLALKTSIEYFKQEYRIPVSKLLPYDSLLVPFSYFFFQNKNNSPDVKQKGYLKEFFWRMSLTGRYSGPTESSLAQDIKRIDKILQGQQPSYDDIMKIDLTPEALINRGFRTGSSYCKAILCLLAYRRPKDFRHNGEVILDNSYLKVSSSRNYHHFFPKKCFGKKGFDNSNSVVNITLISDTENKRIIRDRKPSDYIGKFEKENSDINKALDTHFISIKGFGIEENDYDTFLKARAELMCDQLRKNLDPNSSC